MLLQEIFYDPVSRTGFLESYIRQRRSRCPDIVTRTVRSRKRYVMRSWLDWGRFLSVSVCLCLIQSSCFFLTMPHTFRISLDLEVMLWLDVALFLFHLWLKQWLVFISAFTLLVKHFCYACRVFSAKFICHLDMLAHLLTSR